MRIYHVRTFKGKRKQTNRTFYRTAHPHRSPRSGCPEILLPFLVAENFIPPLPFIRKLETPTQAVKQKEHPYMPGA